MKKIFILFALAILSLTSCQKEKDVVEVEFESYITTQQGHVIEAYRNSTLSISAQIRTNVYPGPYIYWYKYGEPRQFLDENYYDQIRTDENGYHNFYAGFTIPLTDSIYQPNDHYILSVCCGENGSVEGGNVHVIIR